MLFVQMIWQQLEVTKYISPFGSQLLGSLQEPKLSLHSYLCS